MKQLMQLFSTWGLTQQEQTDQISAISKTGNARAQQGGRPRRDSGLHRGQCTRIHRGRGEEAKVGDCLRGEAPDFLSQEWCFRRLSTCTGIFSSISSLGSARSRNVFFLLSSALRLTIPVAGPARFLPVNGHMQEATLLRSPPKLSVPIRINPD